MVKIGRVPREAPTRTKKSIRLLKSQFMRSLGRLWNLFAEGGVEPGELAE